MNEPTLLDKEFFEIAASRWPEPIVAEVWIGSPKNDPRYQKPITNLILMAAVALSLTASFIFSNWFLLLWGISVLWLSYRTLIFIVSKAPDTHVQVRYKPDSEYLEHRHVTDRPSKVLADRELTMENLIFALDYADKARVAELLVADTKVFNDLRALATIRIQLPKEQQQPDLEGAISLVPEPQQQQQVD